MDPLQIIGVVAAVVVATVAVLKFYVWLGDRRSDAHETRKNQEPSRLANSSRFTAQPTSPTLDQLPPTEFTGRADELDRLEDEVQQSGANTPTLFIDSKIHPHGDYYSGEAFGIKVSSDSSVGNCQGVIEDIVFLSPTGKLIAGSLPIAKGFLQWAQHSRTGASPIYTTIAQTAYLDVVLRKSQGYKLDSGGKSQFVFAYANTSTRYSDAPPSGFDILLLVSVSGDEVSPMYAVCRLNPRSINIKEEKRTGELDADGWEKIELIGREHLELVDVCSQKPCLSNYQQLNPSKDDSPTEEA